MNAMERPSNPPSPENSEYLRLARFLADILDQRFTIPGTSIRVGLDPIIGLIPGIGDLLANLTGSLILILAARMGLPKVVLARMGANIAVNTLLGAVPLFGDVLSIWFKSNVRNAELLQRHLGKPGRRAAIGDWLLVLALLIVLAMVLVGVLFLGFWLFTRLWNTLTS